MKSVSFAYVLSSVILATNFAFAADGQGQRPSSERSISQSGSKMVFAESATLGPKQSGGERSIIIVSGKNSKSGLVGSPGSKVMLNPQPLPPKTKVNPAVSSNASKVMLNPQPQPLPPKAR
jgi:hypothetical protein